MSRDGTKNVKSHMNESAGKKAPSKPKGRSFCCSMFVYTFVFVSGVVVATILPDLVGHHFKQPYGKEYGVMVEQIFKDLPKHLNRLSETAVVLGRDLADRVWDLKDELVRRVESLSNKNPDSAKTNSATQRPTTRSKFF
ncbi:unnamed protein product [Rotaria magnacalcarata]|uniref:Uncharacterized protein n=1 Tax=Rotaria magnacalcarata TaxID=392030 RepID=A0A819KAU6_9BILA|nr:unnamed protein product [Rotaria magnacalcarata]CAF1450573.1 unnamed protein product [Rotaria magnacalcarata]CAF2139233.1 unnamed protein product [Rotaria magnacalcarata]CAF2178242.1 unnamed protein product [Rotaria magnacalcarata]CAF2188840.1 unnamed protein product [Rotaria magnacalcarata]